MDEDLLRDLDELDGEEETDEDLEDLINANDEKQMDFLDPTTALLESVKSAEQIENVAKLSHTKQYQELLKVLNNYLYFFL